jgi:site-specific recombinase XerD
MEQRPKRLFDRVREAIRLKHYSIRTEQAYVTWIKRYILFHDKRHPKEIGGPEIEAFLTHLAVNEHVAASTQNQALSALLFQARPIQSVGNGTEVSLLELALLQLTEAPSREKE